MNWQIERLFFLFYFFNHYCLPRMDCFRHLRKDFYKGYVSACRCSINTPTHSGCYGRHFGECVFRSATTTSRQLMGRQGVSLFPGLTWVCRWFSCFGRRQPPLLLFNAGIFFGLAPAPGSHHSPAAPSAFLLTGGAMFLVYISERLDKLKLGNGTSLLIFVTHGTARWGKKITVLFGIMYLADDANSDPGSF